MADEAYNQEIPSQNDVTQDTVKPTENVQATPSVVPTPYTQPAPPAPPVVTPTPLPTQKEEKPQPAYLQGSGRHAFKWPSDKRLVMYYGNWDTYGRNYQVKDLPIDSISDINYAFYNLNEQAEVVSVDTYADTDKKFDQSENDKPYYGNLGEFKKLKDQGKKFNFGISIGGWTLSKGFPVALASSDSRNKAANSMLSLVKKYPGLVDRIDLDWEYPEDKDMSNLADFLKILRGLFDSNGLNNVEIGLCSSAAPAKIQSFAPIIDALKQYLDFVNIMTYDFESSNFYPDKTITTAHNTNLRKTDYTPFSVEEAVDAFLGLGLPADKILIGAAFYSRSFANTDGLGKPSRGTVEDKSWEPGVLDYKDIINKGKYELHYDSDAVAGWGYDSANKVLISFDCVESIKAKVDYVFKKNLKGIIVWEASGDLPISHEKSLTKALYEGLSKSQ
jgi:chitinase